MNFLTYWFFKITWLLVKSVKITKEVAIYKNGLAQSFWKNSVYSSVNYLINMTIWMSIFSFDLIYIRFVLYQMPWRR